MVWPFILRKERSKPYKAVRLFIVSFLIFFAADTAKIMWQTWTELGKKEYKGYGLKYDISDEYARIVFIGNQRKVLVDGLSRNDPWSFMNRYGLSDIELNGGGWIDTGLKNYQLSLYQTVESKLPENDFLRLYLDFMIHIRPADNGIVRFNHNDVEKQQYKLDVATHVINSLRALKSTETESNALRVSVLPSLTGRLMAEFNEFSQIYYYLSRAKKWPHDMGYEQLVGFYYEDVRPSIINTLVRLDYNEVYSYPLASGGIAYDSFSLPMHYAVNLARIIVTVEKHYSNSEKQLLCDLPIEKDFQLIIKKLTEAQSFLGKTSKFQPQMNEDLFIINAKVNEATIATMNRLKKIQSRKAKICKLSQETGDV